MPEQKYSNLVNCTQILSQDLENALTTALIKPHPQPNSHTTRTEADTPERLCGSTPSPTAPKPANRRTATNVSVKNSSRPRAISTSNVLTKGNCNNEPLLEIA